VIPAGGRITSKASLGKTGRPYLKNMENKLRGMGRKTKVKEGERSREGGKEVGKERGSQEGRESGREGEIVKS
jgi:hypothetical protein